MGAADEKELAGAERGPRQRQRGRKTVGKESRGGTSASTEQISGRGSERDKDAGHAEREGGEGSALVHPSFISPGNRGKKGRREISRVRHAE